MIRIEKYGIEKFEQWDEFVENSVNGTIFHTRRFINYHPDDKFEDHSLMFFEKDKLLALFPAVIIEKNVNKVLKSHPGTSYGGLVFKKNLPLDKTFGIINKLENYAFKNDAKQIEFRNSPKIYYSYPVDQYDFALVRKNYLREDEELSTYYYLPDLTGREDMDILTDFSSNTRRNIKRAFKNNLIFTEIRSKKEISCFWDLLKTNLKKHNTEPVHSKEEINWLVDELKNEVNIYGVYKDTKLAAGLMVLRINKLAAHIFYSVIDYDLQETRALNLCVFSLMKKLATDGFKYLNYGISTEDGGKYINKGLFKFKEGFN